MHPFLQVGVLFRWVVKMLWGYVRKWVFQNFRIDPVHVK